MSDDSDTWTEVSATDDGISVSVYSESSDGLVTVEDETWFTYSELRDIEAGTTISLY